MNLKVLSLTLLVLCLANKSFAVRAGNSEFFIGDGFVSIDQLKDINSYSDMEQPTKMTGAIFFTYRYFFTDHIAVGIAAGIDNEQGSTWSNPNLNGGNGGTTGTYTRNTFTLAPELLVKYKSRGAIMMYGYAGLGYTWSQLDLYYYPAYFVQTFHNGISNIGQTNPARYNESHITGQVTFFGIRAGRRAAVFVEFGIGYKGIVNGGFSLKI